jgi:replicative DNA helicase
MQVMAKREQTNPATNKLDSSDANLLQRIPPQSLEAELSLLGSMVLDKDCVGEIIPIVRAESFYRHDNQVIFDALVSLYEKNKPVDLVLLRDELRSRGQLDQVGGVEYLVSLVDSVPSAANAQYYAHIVRDKALLRNLISAANELTIKAYEGRGDVSEIMDEAEQRVFEVTQQKIIGHAQPMREIMTKTFEMIDKRSGNASVVTGLPTGYMEMDELTSGLQPGEMIVVAARPSMGKTALGLNIAEHIGADNQIPVAIFSLEMGSQQLAERMLCGRGHIDSHRLRQGLLSDLEYQKLVDTANMLSEAPIFVDDTPSLTPLELRAKARRLKLQHDIQAVVIDYLQLMHVPGAESRQLEVGIISRHLKSLARELGVPVMVMSQLNRSPEGREGHRPRMSDLRESGNIEQDADVVMLLHREDYYHTELDYEPSHLAEVIVAKQRNGPTGTIQLMWHKQWTRFEALSHAPEPF